MPKVWGRLLIVYYVYLQGVHVKMSEVALILLRLCIHLSLPVHFFSELLAVLISN